MKYQDTALLVFAKAPISGEVNTRLIPKLGVKAATNLQKELIHSRLDALVQENLCELQLWCSPDAGHEFFIDCKKQFDVQLYEQNGEDLGARMSEAIKVGLENFKHVVLIGTDAPALGVSHIKEAIEALHSKDEIVLVPAEDGGYVLIGMNQHYREVFLSIPWGTERVLRKTRGNVIALGLKFNELPVSWDIDRVEDYERYLEMKSSKIA